VALSSRTIARSHIVIEVGATSLGTLVLINVRMAKFAFSRAIRRVVLLVLVAHVLSLLRLSSVLLGLLKLLLLSLICLTHLVLSCGLSWSSLSFFHCSISLCLLLKTLFFQILCFASCIIQINLAFVFLLEISVLFWKFMKTSLDILNFSQVLRQLRVKIFLSFPSCCFVNKSLDLFILDNNLNVSAVVSSSEYSMLIRVAESKKLEQLHPQVLQSVSVVSEQIEVITDCH
jgi:hypothetical protein